ncbi:MAG: hypothetical protein EA370_10080 [Wenzhouxiangella sp.]|nr:MAG: hypothetical protein EA370_10080 [Wenzhouxiangella sp.]
MTVINVMCRLLCLLLVLIAADPAVAQALDCDTRGDYIDALQDHDDPLKERLGRLYAEPDASFCRTVRVRVSPDNDRDWDLSLPDFSALAWLLRAIAVLLLLAGCVWLALNWSRAMPALVDRRRPPGSVRTEHHRLDRPASLSVDIPAAALAAWSDGQPRQALSLLYRGAVQILVPEQAAGSSTEREVLHTLQSRSVPPETLAWMQRLVRAWQRTAWANQAPTDGEFTALHQAWREHCREAGR